MMNSELYPEFIDSRIYLNHLSRALPRSLDDHITKISGYIINRIVLRYINRNICIIKNDSFDAYFKLFGSILTIIRPDTQIFCLATVFPDADRPDILVTQANTAGFYG